VDTAGLSSTVTGEVERGGDASVLRSVHVRYRLPVGPETDRSKIDRVMTFHAQHCGIYRSLHPQIEITTDLELVAVNPPGGTR
jgi:uncharacterized OsmC-like protein